MHCFHISHPPTQTRDMTFDRALLTQCYLHFDSEWRAGCTFGHQAWLIGVCGAAQTGLSDFWTEVEVVVHHPQHSAQNPCLSIPYIGNFSSAFVYILSLVYPPLGFFTMLTHTAVLFLNGQLDSLFTFSHVNKEKWRLRVARSQLKLTLNR